MKIISLRIILFFSLVVLFGTSTISLSYSIEVSDDPRIVIIDDEGNGCEQIGKWNKNSRTCLLTQDIEKYLWIEGSNLTLDGNEHHVQLNKENYMPKLTIDNKQVHTSTIYVLGNNIIIKNIRIEGFPIKFNQSMKDDSYGINCRQTEKIQITDSEFFDHKVGIICNNAEIKNNKFFSNEYAIKSLNTKIINNEFHDNYISIELYKNNIVEKNIIKNSNYIGIKISDIGNTITKNLIQHSGSPFRCVSCNGNTIFYNNFLDNQNEPSAGYDYVAGGNYWNTFDSKSEGCTIIPSSNFCQTSLVFGSFKDPSPWRIQDGWLYDIDVPDDIQTTTQNSDGKSIDFSVSATGPDGSVKVTCSPSSNSIFPIGKTQVICSTPIGVVSSFFVTVLDANVIAQKQQQQSFESGLIGFLKLSSLGLGIFLVILIFRTRKRKNLRIKQNANTRRTEKN